MLPQKQKWKKDMTYGVSASTFGHALGLLGCVSDFVAYQRDYFNTELAFQGNEATAHGIRTEATARTVYEMLTNQRVDDGGFYIYKNDRRLACSPDGIVWDDAAVANQQPRKIKRLLEIKSPYRALYDNTKGPLYQPFGIPQQYMCQMQGQMAIAGATECDFFVYLHHPEAQVECWRVYFCEEFWEWAEPKLLQVAQWIKDGPSHEELNRSFSFGVFDYTKIKVEPLVHPLVLSTGMYLKDNRRWPFFTARSTPPPVGLRCAGMQLLYRDEAELGDVVLFEGELCELVSMDMDVGRAGLFRSGGWDAFMERVPERWGDGWADDPAPPLASSSSQMLAIQRTNTGTALHDAISVDSCSSCDDDVVFVSSTAAPSSTNLFAENTSAPPLLDMRPFLDAQDPEVLYIDIRYDVQVRHVQRGVATTSSVKAKDSGAGDRNVSGDVEALSQPNKLLQPGAKVQLAPDAVRQASLQTAWLHVVSFNVGDRHIELSHATPTGTLASQGACSSSLTPPSFTPGSRRRRAAKRAALLHADDELLVVPTYLLKAVMNETSSSGGSAGESLHWTEIQEVLSTSSRIVAVGSLFDQPDRTMPPPGSRRGPTTPGSFQATVVVVLIPTHIANWFIKAADRCADAAKVSDEEEEREPRDENPLLNRKRSETPTFVSPSEFLQKVGAQQVGEGDEAPVIHPHITELAVQYHKQLVAEETNDNAAVAMNYLFIAVGSAKPSPEWKGNTLAMDWEECFRKILSREATPHGSFAPFHHPKASARMKNSVSSSTSKPPAAATGHSPALVPPVCVKQEKR